MTVGALLAAVLTVLVGTLILADVTGPTATTPPRRILGAHIGLALASLVVVAAGAAAGDAVIAWAGVAVLTATIAFGLAGLRHTLTSPDVVKRPSTTVLTIHGLAALATIVLAVLGATAGSH